MTYDRDDDNLRHAVERIEGLIAGLHYRGMGTYTSGDVVKYLYMLRVDAARTLNKHQEYRLRFGKYIGSLMTEDLREYRYECTDGSYRIKCWANGNEQSMQGLIHERPEWLVSIVDVARISGHLKCPISPPPQEILWFQTDRNNTLINFIELNP